MRTTNPQTLWGIEMEIPGFVEEWEKAGKEGTKMKLIWNELLHANFRCGRMCGERAEEFTVNCTMPSCVRMCTPMERWTEANGNDLPGTLELECVSGVFVSGNYTKSLMRGVYYNV